MLLRAETVKSFVPIQPKKTNCTLQVVDFGVQYLKNVGPLAQGFLLVQLYFYVGTFVCLAPICSISRASTFPLVGDWSLPMQRVSVTSAFFGIGSKHHRTFCVFWLRECNAHKQSPGTLERLKLGTLQTFKLGTLKAWNVQGVRVKFALLFEESEVCKLITKSCFHSFECKTCNICVQFATNSWLISYLSNSGNVLLVLRFV